MRKIVQKNEFSIMKLSARRGLECRILHHLSQSFWGPWATPCHKGRPASSVRRWLINLPATFQFSPATSKSIDIPGLIDSKLGFPYFLEILKNHNSWFYSYKHHIEIWKDLVKGYSSYWTKNEKQWHFFRIKKNHNSFTAKGKIIASTWPWF